MAFPPEYHVTEIKNATVADPVCERTETNWIAGYRTGQDFHIEVDVPDASSGVVYGLNQTLLLAIRSAIYHNDNGEDIQLWRTPPQDTPFDFKGHWIDVDSTDSIHSTLPYYSNEAIAKTELKKENVNGKDVYHVKLHIRKSPQVKLPTKIRRKSKKDERATIKQFDVQEMYLVTLFRDKDMKRGEKTPLIQWSWEYKYAWEADSDGNPKLVTDPGLQFARECTQKRHRWNNYALEGESPASEECHDYFIALNPDYQGGPVGEVSEWNHPETGEWESCDLYET